MNFKNMLRKAVIVNLLFVLLVSSAMPAFAASKKTKRVPMYTGSAWTDIIIDEMVKKAGLKSSMSDEQIVKKTYAYLAKHFKYNSDTKSNKYYHKNPNHTKCQQYQAKINRLKNAGKIKFNTQGCVLETNSSTGKKVICSPLLR